MEQQTDVKDRKKPMTKTKKTLLTLIAVASLVTLAAAAYTVMTATVNIHVDEAFTVQYAYIPGAILGTVTDTGSGTVNCNNLPQGVQYATVTNPAFSLTAMPGETAVVCVKTTNNANAALQYGIDVASDPKIVTTKSAGCGPAPIAAHTDAFCGVQGDVAMDAEPTDVFGRDYRVIVTLTRG